MRYVTSTYMVSTCWDRAVEFAYDITQVSKKLQHSMHPAKTYVIMEGRADSCIQGKFAKVIFHTGRYATLVGYDPNAARTEKVSMVSAFIKTKLSSLGQIPVLLRVNEAPFNSESPITLLPEY